MPERSFLPHTVGYYHRPRVDALIDKGLEHGLVTVVAGPGYGKTLSFSGYLRSAPLTLIWLRLSAQDNDPARFWNNFSTSVRRELPALAGKMDELGFPSSPLARDIFMHIFAQAIYGSGRVAFVVDEYERVHNPDLAALFDGIILSYFENFTLVLLCNENLPFGGVNPGRGHFRITAEDLAFTEDETAALYQSYGIAAGAAESHSATEETGGWPVALQLLCSTQSSAPQGAPGLRHILLASELFEQHYFSGYERELQNMLIALALLPNFPLHVVKMLNQARFGEMVELLSQSPFVSFDHRAELYTFQRMYHDFLRRKAEMLNHEDRQRIYQNAGQWFLQHRTLYEAMDCFWACGNYDGFMQAVSVMPRMRKSASTTNSILQRLNAFPEEYSATHPEVDFARALMLMNNREMEKAKPLLLDAARRLEGCESPEDRLLLGDCYVALCDLSLVQNETDGLPHIEKAVGLLPGGCRVRDRDTMMLGSADAFFLPDGIPISIPEMVDYIHRLAALAHQVDGGSGYGFEWLFEGEAAYYTGNIEKARRLCYQAIEASQGYGQYDITCNAYWQLLRIALYLGDYATAKEMHQQAAAYINDSQLLEMYELRDCMSAWYHLKMGDFSQAAAWMTGHETADVEKPLSLGRDRLIVAYYHYATGHRERAYGTLTQLETLLVQKGLWQLRILTRFMKAQMLLESGEADAAIQSFKLAYDMVYPNDIRVIFAEFGKDGAKLLEAACETGLFDNEWLGQVLTEAQRYSKTLLSLSRAYAEDNHLRPEKQPSLTARETEVLSYMAQGLTREEIGKMLGISVNAIKKHAAKIYTKLGALNQADAVHLATLGGLIS